VQRPLERDRGARLRVVVQGLSERDSEQEQEQGDADTDAPAGQLLPAAAASALFTLDWGERRHGA
jgi:hypothetical protein